jgi:hypothetical protein
VGYYGTSCSFSRVFRIEHTPRHFAFRYKSPEHFVGVFPAYYGPTHKAFAALDAAVSGVEVTPVVAPEIRSRRRRERGGEYLESVITR